MSRFEDKIKDDHIQEIVEVSDNAKKSIKNLSKQLRRRMKQIEKECWSNSTFCDCSANCLKQCSCDKDKKERYVKRLKRKRTEELGTAGATIQMLKQEYGVDIQ